MKLKLTIVLMHLVATIAAQVANRNDVVIDEIMADPSPVIKLPNVEFIELKNVSGFSFNLNGWKVSDGGATATINVNFILHPDSFLIICSNSAVTSFAGIGAAIGVANFPSLDNDAGIISLQSKEGRVIHAVPYNLRWYRNELKAAGGWTLEMIDTEKGCVQEQNWKASNDTNGGTPGKQNSATGLIDDRVPPRLLKAFATDSIHIDLYFDKTLDSASAANKIISA